ncbi:MAG TPA: multiheme c-type cytochrome [Blastocatellia bacterium]|nr:multiheme c-type cytochrome [Blastocatellia bacterium]
MANAMKSPADSEVLRAHPNLTFRNGPFSYRIERSKDGGATYTVTDGKNTISEPILWAFGVGVMGQTFVYHRNGAYVEGRVSYYTQTKGLDITIGHVTTPPKTIEEAFGKAAPAVEARDCFGCHSTASVTQDKSEIGTVNPGIHCEACHGPGQDHIDAMKAGNLDDKHIFNPKTLSTEDLSNFCGNCHRSWETVALMRLRGVNTVRFQPYRLTNSRCYDQDDPRISCLACHNPHEDVRRDIAFYDSKCTACHAAKVNTAQPAATRAAVCPVGKEKCVSCHMPKFELPGGHYKFTDHDIRIVRPNELYPN